MISDTQSSRPDDAVLYGVENSELQTHGHKSMIPALRCAPGNISDVCQGRPKVSVCASSLF